MLLHVNCERSIGKSLVAHAHAGYGKGFPRGTAGPGKMNWITVLWSMWGSACLTLAMVYLFIWFKDRRRLTRDLADSRAQLHENEQQLELAASATDLGAWRWDTARGELWVSDKGRDLLGLNGLPLKSLDDLLAALVPEDRATVRRAVAHALQTGSDYEGECRVLLPNGKT